MFANEKELPKGVGLSSRWEEGVYPRIIAMFISVLDGMTAMSLTRTMARDTSKIVCYAEMAETFRQPVPMRIASDTTITMG